ncbi:MAG: PLP-dependent decarboxylase [Gammaproteobacteria bacterium]|nr:PLP-dependent decarboxylase [Gammaproteobacteria bacterium]
MSFESDTAIIVDCLSQFYKHSNSGNGRCIEQHPMQKLIDELELSKLVAEGGLSGDKLKHFLENYLSGITKIYHPGNVAHQQAVPHYMSALAGLIDNFVSSDGSTYEIGPASVSVEYFLINWLIGKVGWVPAPVPPEEQTDNHHAGGVLLQGGSLSNLTAIIAARTHIAPDVWQHGSPGDLVILAPKHTHYSIARAAGIIGIGHQSVRSLEVDNQGLIIVDRLPEVISEVKSQGKRILAVVANAANTAAGLFDPLQEIGLFCQEHDLWFHIDGAHGGPALLTQKYKHLTKGFNLASSITINMHKLMRVSSTCSALLMRDARTLDQAFVQQASYLFFDKEQPGYDFLHRTIECTKPVLGLKFFMVLAALGESGISDYIERLFDLTMEIYNYLESLPDFECPLEPQSNILCFLIHGVPEGQLLLREELLNRGMFYISTASINDVRYLRLTISNPETNLGHIKELVNELREIRDTGLSRK